MMEVFCQFGIPSIVVCDNGANLNSKVMIEFYDSLGIRVSNSSVANSRGNALAEFQVNRLQQKSRIFLDDLSDIGIFLQVASFLVNNEPRKDRRGLSNFEIMFGRMRAWPLQLPTLSQAKRQRIDNKLGKFIDHANSVREELINVLEEKRVQLSARTEAQKPSLKVGDHVRCKRWQMVGQLKKLFRPFTSEVFVVKSFNRHTGVAELQQTEIKANARPISFKRHCRFLSKIPKPPEEILDDIIIPTAITRDQPVEDKQQPESPAPNSEQADEQNNSNKQIERLTNQQLLKRMHDEQINEPRAKHGMTLRQRK